VLRVVLDGLQVMPPQVSVSAFLPDAYLSVLDENDETVFEKAVEAGQAIEIVFPRSGNYRVIVEQSGQIDEKLIPLLDWKDVVPRPMDFEATARELNRGVYGSMVRQ
jgi:hypothetical protein